LIEAVAGVDLLRRAHGGHRAGDTQYAGLQSSASLNALTFMPALAFARISLLPLGI